ncbi:MAG TPA: hypothetical protein VII96_08060 [Acidimicrobiales bacterium]
MAIYNEILSNRPDLLDVLYEPLHWDRNGEESPGEDPYFFLARLNDVAGLPRFFYIGWYITDAQRLHAREAYQDAADLGERRHLLRL